MNPLRFWWFVAWLALPLLIPPPTTSAQDYNHLLHKNYVGRAKAWGSFWAEKTTNPHYDSTRLFNELLAIRQVARQHGDEGLEMDTYMVELSFFLYRPTYSNQQAQAALDKALRLARQKKLLQEASVEKHYSWFYLNRVKNYELAYEHLLRMYALVEPVSILEFPDKVNCYNKLIEFNYLFGEYRSVIRYAQEAIGSEQKVHTRHHIKNNLMRIGQCYRALHRLDSSDHYFRAALREARQLPDSEWVHVSQAELGMNQFLRHQYAQAEPFLRLSLSEAGQPAQVGVAAQSLLALGAIALHRNQPDQAGRYLHQARQRIGQQPDIELQAKLYGWLSKLHALRQQPHLAWAYADSAVWATDSLNRQFNARKMLKAQQADALRKHRAEMQVMESQKRLNELERNLVLGLLIGLVLLALYGYYHQRRNHRQRQLRMQTELQRQEDELRTATEQLRQFARSIAEKNKLLEDLQQQLGSSANEAVLQRLQTATILTEDQWEYFRHLFEQVHTGFLRRAREKLPNLTPAEIRFLALVKLQFSNREMAAVLGISPTSVRSIWFRLRKKLGIPEDGSVEELIATIG